MLAVSPATEASASGAPDQLTSTDADQLATAGARTVTPAVQPNFGQRKVRVGVQIKDGSFIPPSLTTENTVVVLRETGPGVAGGELTTECTTQPGSQPPGSTESYCQFDYEIGSDTYTYDLYTVQPGDSLTVRQETVGANLRRDRRVFTLDPCVDTPNGDYPLCPDEDDLTFDDPVARDLYDLMSSYDPTDYWVLDTFGGTTQESLTAPPLGRAGTGPKLTLGVPANPPTGEPGSVRLNADGRQSGQYLRSGLLSSGDGPGSIVIWFRTPKALPRWTQALAVDNGAWSGTGGGLMIDKAGRLISADSSGFVDYRSKQRVTDGRWHCAVWVDTFDHSAGDQSLWRGSTLYLDGERLTSNLTAVWARLLGVPRARLLLGDAGPREAATIGRFTGNLSNVAIYDQLLNADQVFQIWAVGENLLA